MADAAYVRWAIDELGVEDPSVREAWGGGNSVVYEITSGGSRWFLKIGSGLRPECERLRWLDGRLPVPEVAAFRDSARLEAACWAKSTRDALLTTAIPGTDLSLFAKRLPTGHIVAMLARALRLFHAADASGCPFTAAIPGGVLVHGDACLPNVMFLDDESLSGFVDLGDMGAGDAETDLAAAVWSLQYNLGPGHGLAFLKAYGLPAPSERDVDRLWAMYANS